MQGRPLLTRLGYLGTVPIALCLLACASCYRHPPLVADLRPRPAPGGLSLPSVDLVPPPSGSAQGEVLFLGDRARFRTEPPSWPGGLALGETEVTPASIEGNWSAESWGCTYLLHIGPDGRGTLTESGEGKVHRWLLVSVLPGPSEATALDERAVNLVWAYDSDGGVPFWLFEKTLVLTSASAPGRGVLHGRFTLLFGFVDLVFRRVPEPPAGGRRTRPG